MNQKSRLTDLLIDGKIEQKDYDEKKLSFQRKLHQITEEKAYLEENIGAEEYKQVHVTASADTGK